MPYKDKSKQREQARKYYLSHKAQFKEYNKKSREKNREAWRERSKRHYLEHNDYYVQYRKEHSEKNKEYQRQYKLEHKDSIRESSRRYRAEHKEELKQYKIDKEGDWGDAHYQTHLAVRYGRLKRQPCEICGDSNSQAHHDDYNKPLAVRWLCQKHHSEWHTNNKPIYRKETVCQPKQTK